MPKITQFLNYEYKWQVIVSTLISEFVKAEFTTEKNARASDSNTLEEVATTVYLQKQDVSKLGKYNLLSKKLACSFSFVLLFVIVVQQWTHSN